MVDPSTESAKAHVGPVSADGSTLIGNFYPYGSVYSLAARANEYRLASPAELSALSPFVVGGRRVVRPCSFESKLRARGTITNIQEGY